MMTSSFKAVFVLPAFFGVLASCSLTSLNTGYDVGGAGGTGGGAGGHGAGMLCSPGETRSCYNGPLGTESKGICKAGVETCALDGMSYGACAGEILPQIENCATPQDEDCDGLAPSCQGACLWSKRYGDVSPSQQGTSVTTDSEKNVLLTGAMAGQIDFGGGPLDSAGGTDIFVTKLAPNGAYSWGKRFGGANFERGVMIAADKADNVLVLGDVTSPDQFNIGGSALVGAGGLDMLLTKLDSSGAPLWSKLLGDANGQMSGGIATDVDNNIFITGAVWGSIDLGGGALTSTGDSNVLLAKLDPSGDHVWSRLFGNTAGPSGGESTNIKVDIEGNVLLAGHFSGLIDFGGASLASTSVSDQFLAKFDAFGEHVWSLRLTGTGLKKFVSIDLNSAGEIFVTGYFTKEIDAGGSIIKSAGGFDAFLAKYNANGTFAWIKRFGDEADQFTNEVVVDNVGNVILVGSMLGSADFGGGFVSSAGDRDIFIAKFDPNGTHIWSKRFGDAAEQIPIGVTVDSTGDLLVTGSLSGQADFGCGPLASAGDRDVFVVKLSP